MNPRVANILAITYSDGFATDRLIAEIAYRLRGDGVKIAGLVQVNTEVPGRTKCEMAVEELYTGTRFQLSEERGPAARGCRLDHSRLVDAAGLLTELLDKELDLIILNKFGKVEAEGGGLRDVIGRAVLHDIPLIVGVPYRNLDQWRIFAAGLADECEVSAAHINRWLLAKGWGIPARGYERPADGNLELKVTTAPPCR